MKGGIFLRSYEERACLTVLRPIWRSSRPFAKGPVLKAQTRSAITRLPSGSVFTPGPPSRAVARRLPPNRSRMASLVEFVAILESSVSFPFVAPSLPRPSSPIRGVLLRRGIPLPRHPPRLVARAANRAAASLSTRRSASRPAPHTPFFCKEERFGKGLGGLAKVWEVGEIGELANGEIGELEN